MKKQQIIQDLKEIKLTLKALDYKLQDNSTPFKQWMETKDLITQLTKQHKALALSMYR